MAITTIFESRVKIPEDIYESYVSSDKDYECMILEAAKGSFESETDLFSHEEIARFYDYDEATEFEKKVNGVFNHFKNTERK